jgi:hypothetical protein
VTKPFSPRELVLRVQAIVRRGIPAAAATPASQSEALPEVERRLELLGGRERLRWLVPADRTPERGQKGPDCRRGACDGQAAQHARNGVV